MTRRRTQARNRRGQSTVEYLAILAVIIAAVLAVLAGPMGQAITNMANNSGTASQSAADLVSSNLTVGSR